MWSYSALSSSSFWSLIISSTPLASLFNASAASILLNSKAKSAEVAFTGAARRFLLALSMFDVGTSFAVLSSDGRTFFAGGPVSWF